MDLFFWLDRKVFKANYPKWDSLRLELIRRVCFFVCVSVNALIERNFTEVPAWDLGAFFSVSQPMSHLYYLIMSCFLGMNLNPIYRKISMFFVQRMPRMGKYIDIRYTPAIEINKSNCPLQDESRKKSPKQNLSLFFPHKSLKGGGGRYFAMVRPQFSDVSSNDLKLGSSGELAQMDPILQESGCGVLRNLTANHDEYKALCCWFLRCVWCPCQRAGGSWGWWLGEDWILVPFFPSFFHLMVIVLW